MSEDDFAADLDLLPIRLEVADRFDGWRLDHFIHARIPRLSRNRIQRMLRAQRRYSGVVLRPAQRVRAGQRLVIWRPAPIEPEVPRTFGVIYQDQQLLAIDKPAGLPVHATARFFRNTLTAVLRERFPAGEVPNICHRLDRETSGLMLLARTHRAEVELKQAFFQRRVNKAYLAIVRGDPGDEGTIDQPIGPDSESGIRIRRMVGEQGQPACTLFRRIERRGAFSLVEARPVTGRQHQIRVHLAWLGTPVVGDKLYGVDPSIFLEYTDHGWSEEMREQLLLPRQALHAARAHLIHPETGEPLTLECPLSADLQRFWADLPR